jgi:hypothetical protein
MFELDETHEQIQHLRHVRDNFRDAAWVFPGCDTPTCASERR